MTGGNAPELTPKTPLLLLPGTRHYHQGFLDPRLFEFPFGQRQTRIEGPSLFAVLRFRGVSCVLFVVRAFHCDSLSAR